MLKLITCYVALFRIFIYVMFGWYNSIYPRFSIRIPFVFIAYDLHPVFSVLVTLLSTRLHPSTAILRGVPVALFCWSLLFGVGCVQTDSGASQAVSQVSLWPADPSGGHLVRFFFTASFPYRSEVRAAIEHVNKSACLRFEELPSRPNCADTSGAVNSTICVMLGATRGACVVTGRTLAFPPRGCRLHEALQCLVPLLGLHMEHRRPDRDQHIRLMLEAGETDSLHALQSDMAKCDGQRNDMPYDLFSVTHFNSTANKNLQDGSIIISTVNIRHQWILDYKSQRDLGLSFYDRRALVSAYQCQAQWKCSSTPGCENHGYMDAACRCVCPPGYLGVRCHESSSDQSHLESNCSTELESESDVSLRDLGLQDSGHLFYACDITIRVPFCQKMYLRVDTSSIHHRILSTSSIFESIDWCNSYFSLMVTHTDEFWRTYCLDEFAEDPIRFIENHRALNTSRVYIRIRLTKKSDLADLKDVRIGVLFKPQTECALKIVGEVQPDDEATVVVMLVILLLLLLLLIALCIWLVSRSRGNPAANNRVADRSTKRRRHPATKTDRNSYGSATSVTGKRAGRSKKRAKVAGDSSKRGTQKNPADKENTVRPRNRVSFAHPAEDTEERPHSRRDPQPTAAPRNAADFVRPAGRHGDAARVAVERPEHSAVVRPGRDNPPQHAGTRGDDADTGAEQSTAGQEQNLEPNRGREGAHRGARSNIQHTGALQGTRAHMERGGATRGARPNMQHAGARAPIQSSGANQSVERRVQNGGDNQVVRPQVRTAGANQSTSPHNRNPGARPPITNTSARSQPHSGAQDVRPQMENTGGNRGVGPGIQSANARQRVRPHVQNARAIRGDRSLTHGTETNQGARPPMKDPRPPMQEARPQVQDARPPTPSPRPPMQSPGSPVQGARPQLQQGGPNQDSRPQLQHGGLAPNQGAKPQLQHGGANQGARPQLQHGGANQGARPQLQDDANQGARPQLQHGGANQGARHQLQDDANQGARPKLQQGGANQGARPQLQHGSANQGARPQLHHGGANQGARPQLQHGGANKGAMPQLQHGGGNQGARPQLQHGGANQGARHQLQDDANQGARPQLQQGGANQGAGPQLQHGGANQGARPQLQHGGANQGARPQLQHGGANQGARPQLQHGGANQGARSQLQHGGANQGARPQLQHGGANQGARPQLQHGGANQGARPQLQHGGANQGARPQLPQGGANQVNRLPPQGVDAAQVTEVGPVRSETNRQPAVRNITPQTRPAGPTGPSGPGPAADAASSNTGPALDGNPPPDAAAAGRDPTPTESSGSGAAGGSEPARINASLEARVEALERTTRLRRWRRRR